MPRLSDFKNSFGKDLARQSRFNVFIPLPSKILPSSGGDSLRSLSYRCEIAQLPGRTLATTDQRTYGPIQKHPYLTTYTDIDLTLIVTDGLIEKKIFDNWIEYINPTSTNDFNYRRSYETALTINQYDVTDKLSYSVNLYEAYPISMNQLDLDWSSEGYHKLMVTFAYTYWRSDSQKDFTQQSAPTRTMNAI